MFKGSLFREAIFPLSSRNRLRNHKHENWTEFEAFRRGYLSSLHLLPLPKCAQRALSLSLSVPPAWLTGSPRAASLDGAKFAMMDDVNGVGNDSDHLAAVAAAIKVTLR